MTAIHFRSPATEEPPAQHIRNALAVLGTCADVTKDAVTMKPADFEAVVVRLWKAIRQLEA